MRRMDNERLPRKTWEYGPQLGEKEAVRDACAMTTRILEEDWLNRRTWRVGCDTDQGRKKSQYNNKINNEELLER